jgi:membrane protein
VPEVVSKMLSWASENAGPLHPVTSMLRWGFVFYRQLGRDLAFVRAAGMAYATMVALVPGLAVAWFVLSAAGDGDPEQALGTIFNRLFGQIPGLSETLLPLLVQVDLQAAGAVGVAGLLLVASRLYLMVEKAYSDVFSVSVTRRPMAMRLLSFYFCMTAGPLVMGFLLRGSFRLTAGLGVAGLQEVLALALQYLLLVVALKMLPATHVRWPPALVGAGVSFTLLEIGRWGLGLYVSWVVSADPLSAVYGSLGFVPVFLLWIYLVWVFILLGVEVAQVMQNYSSLVESELALADHRPHWPSPETALRVAAWVGWSFANGHGPITSAMLAERSHLEPRTIHPVLEVLSETGVVVRATKGWILSRPADAIRIRDVVTSWLAHTGVGAVDDVLAEEFGLALELRGSLADGIDRWLPSSAPGIVSEAAANR